MDTDEVPDQLKCPVCFEVPEREIFLCKNGHTICKQCCANVPHCPQCRVPYEEGKVRCRPLESLLDTLKISCPHKENGCQEKIVVKTLKRHSENCIHNGHCILFCRQLGFPCEFWVNTLSVSKAVEHFQQNHDFLLLEETRVAIHMENFRDCCLRRNEMDGGISDSMWQPMLLKQDTSSMASSNNRGPTFLILSLVNGEDETLSWLCLSIGDSSISSHMEGGSSGKYQVEFRIKNKSKEVTELQWKVPPTEILLSKVAIQTPSFRVPIELLLNHYTDDDGSLLLNVFITRNTSTGGSVALDEVEMAEVAGIATLEPIWTFNVPFKRESSSRPRHRPPPSTNNTGLNLNLTVPSSSSNLSSGQGQNPLSLLDGTGSTGKKLLNAANQQINQNMELENLPCASGGMFGALGLGKRSQEGRQHMQKLVQQLIDGRNDNNESTTTSDPNSADVSLLSPIDEGVVSSTSLVNEDQQQNQAQQVLPLQSLFGDNPGAFRGPPTDNQAGSSGGGGRAFDFGQQTSTTATSSPFTLTLPVGSSTSTVGQGDNGSNITGRKIKKPVRRFF